MLTPEDRAEESVGQPDITNEPGHAGLVGSTPPSADGTALRLCFGGTRVGSTLGRRGRRPDETWIVGSWGAALVALLGSIAAMILLATIVRAGTEPIATISSPVANDIFTAGQTITVTGVVTADVGDTVTDVQVWVAQGQVPDYSTPGGATIYTATVAGGQFTQTLTLPIDGPISYTLLSRAFSTDGSSTFTQTTPMTVPIQLNPVTSTTTLSAPATSTFGESATLTATVASTITTPAGNVSFFDNGDPLGTVALSGGVATLTTAAIKGGNRTLSVLYPGQPGIAPSGATSPITVDRAAPTLTVTSSPNPSVHGQSVTFTASITAAAAITTSVLPTGMVIFHADGSAFDSAVLNGSGVASVVTSTLPVGTRVITASYSGDGNYLPATSLDHNHVVNQAATTVSVVSNPTPSVFGQAVTITATVGVVAPGAGTPAGAVTFTVGSNVVTQTLSGLSASIVTTTMPIGSTPITATYAGDTSFALSSSSPYSHTVNPAATATTLTTSPNSSVFGETVTLTATVAISGAGAGTPTGMVSFAVGATQTVTSTISGGVATYVTNTLPVGTTPITATYLGDSAFTSSAGTPVNQAVTKAATSLALSFNPGLSSTFGDTVTLFAMISTNPAAASGIISPTGTVTFSVDALVIGTASLSGGTAALNTTQLPGGVITVTATYGGDAIYTGSSTQQTYTVNRGQPSVSITTAPNPSVHGQGITVTATVTATAAITTGNPPAGTVTFFVDGVSTGPRPVSAGAATYFTNTLPAGARVITGTYSGDTNYLPATSGVYTHTVNPAATTTTVSSFPNPSVYSQTVTFTATVAAVAPGGGVPTGTVTFTMGSTIVTRPLITGTAVYTTNTLPGGTTVVTATYGGVANYSASTSAPYTQTVAAALASVSLTNAPNPSSYGQVVTFTASVTSTAGTPTGTVTFREGVTVLGTSPLVAGSAVFTTSTLLPGTRVISATYNGDGNVAPASASTTQTVTKLNQTIDFPQPPDRAVNDSPFTVVATATSGLAVEFSTSGPCTVSGNQVTLLSPGTCVIKADQPGNAIYAPAPQVVRSFTVGNAPTATATPTGTPIATSTPGPPATPTPTVQRIRSIAIPIGAHGGVMQDVTGPTATPSPSATPAPIVTNGTFSGGLNGWAGTGALPVGTANGPFGGPAAQLGDPGLNSCGGVPIGAGQIAQKVQLPNRGTTLKFDWQIRTRDIKETLESKTLVDTFDVYVVDASGDSPPTGDPGGRVLREGRTATKTDYPCTDPEATLSGSATIDLAGKAGKSVWIIFQVWNRLDRNDNTVVLLDNVRIE